MIKWIRSYFAEKQREEDNKRWQEQDMSLRAQGWRRWETTRPEKVRVWATRPEWMYPQVFYPEHMPPEMNISNLYWKPFAEL